MIQMFKVHIPQNLSKLTETLNSGFVAEGPKVKEFEQKIAKWVNNEKVIALNSGTSALHLSLVLADVKPGDIVITTPITSPATNISIVNIGANIVWADVDSETSNIYPQSIEKMIKKHGNKVKAVIAVDWAGYPCDYDMIKSVLPGNVKLIQDAAHSLGATYKNDLVGSLVSDFTTFSFQAIKHITTGDGGLIACKDEESFERGKRLRWFGIDRNKPGRTWNDDLLEIGYKFHMNDIAASIGLHQLDELNYILERRREIADTYISEIPQLRYQFSIDYPALSAYWLFTIYENNLDGFMKFMQNEGINAFPVHIRNDFYTGFKNVVFDSDKLIGVEKVSDSMCCIPVGEWLSNNEIDIIISSLKKWIRNEQ